MVLKELTQLSGVSGDERAVRAYILEKAKPFCDELHVDRIGNVIATRRARLAPNGCTAFFAAHMDEVGMIVKGVRDDGTIAYETVGGIDPRVAVSKRVFVGKNRVPGVIGAKAIHLQTRAEMEKVLGHDELSIDVGAKDKASCEKLVSPGDYVTLEGEWHEFGGGLVRAKALDDRVGCAAMLALLEGDYPCDLVCAFTVQEEIGCRGAQVAANGLSIDCAVVLEGTAANDLGDVPEHMRVCRVKEGVAISFMDKASMAHRGLFERMREIAEEAGVAWQIKRFVSGGNDSGPLQRAHGACPTVVLSVPCRYIHSQSCVAALSDVEAQYALADAFLTRGATFSQGE